MTDKPADSPSDDGQMASLPPLLVGHLQRLRHKDLNGLVTLYTVLSTRSVSSAARLLGLSQPVVSRTLERLRRDLDDPLVVRQGNGMAPTRRAQQLMGLLEPMLDQAHQVFCEAAFDPAHARRDVRIAMNEHLQQLLMPGLLERTARQAPGVRLFARTIHQSGEVQALREGELDLAVGMLQPTQALRSQPLMSELLVCLARRDLARALADDRPLVADAFRRHPQIDVRPAGMGRISASLDALFAGSMPRRNVACVLSSFGALFETLGAGLHIGVAPELAFPKDRYPDLVPVALGFELPRYEVSAWWHNVAHNDPVVQWLLAQLRQMCVR